MISSEREWFHASRQFVKPSQEPLCRHVQDFRGCPESCGSCPEHQQHSCLPIFEITSRCDLACPVCLKNFSKHFEWTEQEFQTTLAHLLKAEGQVPVINLSGGEPTLHPKLRSFILSAKERGIGHVTVSTNGLTLLSDPELRRFFADTNTIAAVQFDGFRSDTSLRLRGVDLVQQKLELVETLQREGVNFSLVSTVAENLNADEIPQIVEFFFQSAALTLMFQPVCHTGNAAENFDPQKRLTTSAVIQAIGRSHYAKADDFNPLPCSHYSCFSLAYYFHAGSERAWSLRQFLGEDIFLNAIANRTLPQFDGAGYAAIKARLYEIWSAADSLGQSEEVLKRVRAALHAMHGRELSEDEKVLLAMRNMKAIFIHSFMDAHTFDFGRAVKCCNPYAKPDGRMVPMCVENVFEGGSASSGE